MIGACLSQCSGTADILNLCAHARHLPNTSALCNKKEQKEMRK